MNCFLIFSYKILKLQIYFFNFFELTLVTRDPTPWPGQPRIGFDNYAFNVANNKNYVKLEW